MPNIIIPRPRYQKPALGVRPNPNDALTEGLELCYFFNENSGQIVNNSAATGQKYNGIMQAAANWIPSRGGSTVDFAVAANSFIDIPGTMGTPFLGPLTIFARGLMRTGSAHRDIITKGLLDGGTNSPFSFRINNANAMVSDRANGSTFKEFAGPAITLNQFHNLSVMFPNETCDVPPVFYYDTQRFVGSLIGGSANGPCTDTANSDMRIGRRTDNATQWDGQFECLYVWSRDLMEAEINRLEDNIYCFADAPTYRAYSYFFSAAPAIVLPIPAGSQVIVIS